MPITALSLLPPLDSLDDDSHFIGFMLVLPADDTFFLFGVLPPKKQARVEHWLYGFERSRFLSTPIVFEVVAHIGDVTRLVCCSVGDESHLKMTVANLWNCCDGKKKCVTTKQYRYTCRPIIVSNVSYLFQFGRITVIDDFGHFCLQICQRTQSILLGYFLVFESSYQKFAVTQNLLSTWPTNAITAYTI